MKCSLLTWFIFDTLEKTVVVFLYCFAIFPRVPQKLKPAYIPAPHVAPKETILNLYERVTWAA